MIIDTTRQADYICPYCGHRLKQRWDEIAELREEIAKRDRVIATMLKTEPAIRAAWVRSELAK